jgi:hypothetical protein
MSPSEDVINHCVPPSRKLARDQPKPTPSENQFEYRAIIRESRKNARVIKERLGHRWMTLECVIDCQSRLSGILLKEGTLKQMQDLVYTENLLLNNTLLNLPYRAHSILLLIKNSMYGAARPLVRQAFEQMLLAKQSELEPAIVEKWHQQERLGAGSIIKRLAEEGKNVAAMKDFWEVLNRMTHPTREAMQPLLVPLYEHPENGFPFQWVAENKLEQETASLDSLLANSMFTLDMLYVILGMNFHLLVGHMERKARGYFPGSKEPEEFLERKRMLKDRARRLLNEYSSGIPMKGRGYFRKVVFQFRQDWRA